VASNVTFDGLNRVITVNSGLSAIDAQVDLYSEWKVFAQSADNLKFGQVFRPTGGDPIGGGLFQGAYFFLQNGDVVTPSATHDGWRVRPDERTHELRIDGNLFGEDTGEVVTVPTLGLFTVLVRLNTSQLTQAITTGATAVQLSGIDAQLSAIDDVTSEMHQYWGLNSTHPLFVSAEGLSAGFTITQVISTAGGTTTVSRV